MSTLESVITSKIKQFVEVVDKQAEVYLFGSRARKDSHENSDWDLLILTPSEVDLKYEQKFRHKLFELELEFGIALSVFAYSEQKWNTKYTSTPFYKNILRDRIKL